MIKQEIALLKTKGKSIGFVPTMGALHDGHLQLVKKCVSENDIAIVSVFVNPIQFNNQGDLKNYPRNFSLDLKKLENTGCHIVFHPTENEMYPDGRPSFQFDLGGLDMPMEGRFRPGHFNGVAIVVSMLFEIVSPHRAYFGKKDFQQLAIIKYMVSKLKLPVHIVACDTVREADGLAMSSRNALLPAETRKKAPIIFKALNECKASAFKIPLIECVKKATEKINNTGLLKVEYLVVVDETTLQEADTWDNNREMVACVAAWAGDVRLIDNLKLNP